MAVLAAGTREPLCRCGQTPTNEDGVRRSAKSAKELSFVSPAHGMARVINTQTPAKARHEHMRSCAGDDTIYGGLDPAFDDEAKDMCAFLVFNLRDIYRIIDESAQSWDDRNYWKKSEKLRHDWRWARIAADEVEARIVDSRWSEMPEYLISLVPRFDSISVSSVTRNADWWCGALRALQRNRPT